ncbi:Endonuclease YncB, thermonuclease family [Limimonas halophila]|uniref:Endonuclease YncB, thermonuclease family n=1 Tax=Limimonas halophila TaxID=1082479 RepID=A0A1G7RJ26_9PROT|nr:thermonuclease family protein [Limimonas halophila]SDG10773.1 Endonuclease YncB, thermonuclease family [Limimonas halophila]
MSAAVRRRRVRLAALAAILVLTGPAAKAADLPAALADGGTGRVAEVIDGDTVHLADGRSIRLVGIQAPELNPGQADVPAQPHARQARRALVDLAAGARVHLGYGGRRRDRHGRYLAHLYLRDGTWLQGELVRRGAARVYSFADNTALVDRLLRLEQQARRADRGLWALDRYRVRSRAGTHEAVGSWQIVEARVRRAEVVDRRVYLNFGRDWRTDFTVTIPPEARAAFDAAGLTARRLEGRRIRVRGWIESYNGPQIEVSHPEQIEVIGK